MKTIDRYRIRGLLGRGGMSKVYKVEVPVVGKILALKLLAPHQVLVSTIGISRLKELFRSEAVTLASLNHPKIVSVWDYGEHQGMPFYVMDYFFNSVAQLIGESASPEDPSRPLPVEQSIALLRQTLEGLECLHASGVIHRDIKPFNLLIDPQGVLKICDFGLSKLRGESLSLPPQLKVGSPWYAAPEQELDPESIDERADLYAVGISLQRMLTGQLSTASDRLPSRVHPDLDASWDAYIRRSTAAEREKRFENARQMLIELDRLEAAWHIRKEKICALFSDESGADAAEPSETRFQARSQPTKISPLEAQATLPVDKLWRPSEYRQLRFEIGSEGGTLINRHSGCGWQSSGSPFPMDWQDARRYIEDLNRSGFEGIEHWRLPTVEELLTLLTPPLQGEALCIEPLFDRRQTKLWSCDRRSFVAAWYASLELGFIDWQDFSARHYVRAVHTL